MKQKKDQEINIGNINNAKGGQLNIGGSGNTQNNRWISTGNGLYNEGSFNVQGNYAGGDQYNFSADTNTNSTQFFDRVYQIVEQHANLSRLEKEDLTVDLREVEEELTKGDLVDESFLARKFRNIKRMAPDILDVIIATLANPVAGFSLVIRKIAERMKAEENL